MASNNIAIIPPKKREKGDDFIDDNQIKRKRPNVEKNIKITDFNDDCLQAIFEYLSLTDLINLLDANTRFTEVACYVLTQKSRQQLVTVSNEPNQEKLQSMKLLNQFGGLITKLRVDYIPTYRRYDKPIDDAIIEHCRASLVEIEFKNAEALTMAEIDRPFLNVSKVTFTEGTMSNFIGELSKWFPNARSLELNSLILSDNDNVFENFLHKNFPALEHFTVMNGETYDSDKKLPFSMDEVKLIITHNPQLKGLSLKEDNCDYFDMSTMYNIFIYEDFLDFINYNLPHLTHLDLVCRHEKNFQSQVKFANLKSLKLSLVDNYIPIAADQLEHLTLELVWYDEWYEFFSVHQSIQSLKFDYYLHSIAPYEKMIKLAMSLPNLREVELPFKLGTDEYFKITQLLKDSKLLTKLRVYLPKEPQLHTTGENRCDHAYFFDGYKDDDNQRRNFEKNFRRTIEFVDLSEWKVRCGDYFWDFEKKLKSK